MESIRDYKKDYESLRRLHDSANEAITSLQQQINSLQEKLRTSMEIAALLEKQMFQQKEINMKSILSNNETQQKNAEEIQRLRDQVKSLGGDPN